MPRHYRRDPIFRYRRYEDDIVVLCVRWYISYRLSLRDLTEMMAERGLVIYPSTIWRWVQRFVTEFREALRRASTADWQLLACRRNVCVDSGQLVLPLLSRR